MSDGLKSEGAYNREELLGMLEEKKKDKDFFEHFFPIVTIKEGRFNMLHGTCFYIENNLFMTAAHCIQSIPEGDKSFILTEIDGAWKGMCIEEANYCSKLDIAIVRVLEVYPNIKAIKWNKSMPKIFTSVFTCGYPHGLPIGAEELQYRGLQGYVVGVNYHVKLKTNVIETSFFCPKGISGAPLIQKDSFEVIGVIIGNTTVTMMMHESAEFDEDGNELKYYYNEETASFGMATPSSNLFEIESRLLSGKLEDYLISNNLLNP